MKHIFIINTNAGNGKKRSGLEYRIHNSAKKCNIDYDIITSNIDEDTKQAIKHYSENNEKVRFYACGGDGTLSVISNYILGLENAEVAMIPVGSGNDFPRSFTNVSYFDDIERQINGESIDIDAISFGNKICVNVLNTGFDSCVVAEMEKIKRRKFIPGKMTYILGIIKCFLTMPTVKLEMTLDDGSVISEELLLFVAANASFYGGGFKAASEALINDGLIDVIMVKKVPRLKFIMLISDYKKGKIINTNAFKKVGKFLRVKKLSLSSDNEFLVSSDGELSKQKHIDISILKSRVKFSVPLGCAPINTNALSDFAKAKILTN